MGESIEKVKTLFKWATEHNLQDDPERISKLHDEARRRWDHLMPRRRIGVIVEETLRKME